VVGKQIAAPDRHLRVLWSSWGCSNGLRLRRTGGATDAALGDLGPMMNPKDLVRTHRYASIGGWCSRFQDYVCAIRPGCEANLRLRGEAWDSSAAVVGAFLSGGIMVKFSVYSSKPGHIVLDAIYDVDLMIYRWWWCTPEDNAELAVCYCAPFSLSLSVRADRLQQ
jgi:hypothetical protein